MVLYRTKKSVLQTLSSFTWAQSWFLVIFWKKNVKWMFRMSGLTFFSAPVSWIIGNACIHNIIDNQRSADARLSRIFPEISAKKRR